MEETCSIAYGTLESQNDKISNCKEKNEVEKREKLIGVNREHWLGPQVQ